MNYRIDFYKPGTIENERLKYAIIISRINGRWIFVRHKDRSTWEVPGGHREPGEDIAATARRELYEESGAEVFKIIEIADYSVEADKEIGFGRLFFAEVEKLAGLPQSEIAEVRLFDAMPENLTYPEVQKVLFKRVLDIMEAHDGRI